MNKVVAGRRFGGFGTKTARDERGGRERLPLPHRIRDGIVERSRVVDGLN